MPGRSTLANLVAILELVSIASSLGNQSPQGFLRPIQGADTADLQKINSTVQQGFHTMQQSFHTLQQNFQSITEELNEIRQLLSTSLSPQRNSGSSPSNSALSCKDIYYRNTSSPSGYYWLQSRSERAIRVYCDMERTCGGVHGGWMKVASIDMTNSTHSCPSGLRTLTSPKRLCAMNINGPSYSSSHLDVHCVQYSRVCGKIIGYQQKSSDAFGPYYHNRAKTIDDNYVEGISLTYGHHPTKHIWTFAAALHEVLFSYPHYIYVCPCGNINNHLTIPIPPYVGNNYFCDTASSQEFQYRFYPYDPLWDGHGCGTLNTCCSFNNPPWFMKQLSTTTDDNIEMRLCSDQERSNEDIVFETLELYVQ